MFPYNIVESQGEELIRKCQEKNVGFIAMKPLAGGAIENGTLALLLRLFQSCRYRGDPGNGRRYPN